MAQTLCGYPHNVSVARKDCVEAWMAGKAADMGYFDEYKDSAGNKASSAATCINHFKPYWSRDAPPV
jgi:hypothetical protein